MFNRLKQVNTTRLKATSRQINTLRGGLFATVLLLSACAAPMNDTSLATNTEQMASKSERLGTQWGDEVNSSVTMVDLRRKSREPITQSQLRYAAKRYNGKQLNSLSLAAGAVSLSVESDGHRLPLFRDQKNYYLQGKSGQAYQLVYKNHSDSMFEVVTSVDGLNVLNGKAASRYANGYVLEPNGRLVIEGFRKSQSAVASFIFSSPDDAYANKKKSGSTRNTGVIGNVLYELYDPRKPKKSDSPQAFPADNGYAPTPE